MTEKDERLLCDYIFGLLEEDEKNKAERLIENSVEHRHRLDELRETFGCLDLLKEDYVSPLTKAGRFTFRFSAAAAVLMFTLMSFGFVNQATAGSSVSETQKIEHPHSCKEHFFTPVSTIKCHGSDNMDIKLELDRFDPLTVSSVN